MPEVKAGRELDAEVAEKVMGWKYAPTKHDESPWWEVPVGDPCRDPFGSADGPPPYSALEAVRGVAPQEETK